MKLNKHTSHPAVFISSTFQDLKHERMAVVQALSQRNINVSALDVKPASNSSAKNQILAGIRESDFLVLIIANRFGAILPQMTGSNQISVTWWEYKCAIEMGKPVIAYFKNLTAADQVAGDAIEDPLYSLKRTNFELFKKIISSKHCPSYFSNSSELAESVDKAIIPTYREAVVSLSEKNSKLESTVSSLENEIAQLKSPKTTAYLGNPGLSSASSLTGQGLGGIHGGLSDLTKKT
jgi:hypothetical protein